MRITKPYLPKNPGHQETNISAGNQTLGRNIFMKEPQCNLVSFMLFLLDLFEIKPYIYISMPGSAVFFQLDLHFQQIVIIYIQQFLRT